MSLDNGKPASLRFVDLIRVSTERQEQQGESLTIQRLSNSRDIERLNGIHVATYGGQEHATEGWERKEVDRLLADAALKKFDAVMVAYADRWSRDNDKSNQGLDVFRQYGIKFYIGATEKNLFDPSAILELDIQAAIGKYTALNQSKKSLDTRIYRARTQGKPTSGPQRPWGRTWDEKTGWSIIPEKQQLIQDVAKRFLNGEGLTQLSVEKGMSNSNLHKVLRKLCGDTWTQTFKNPKLNIHEEVVTTIPRLLDDETIRLVGERLEAGRSYVRSRTHSHPDYLLTGYIFCASCGYALGPHRDMTTGHLVYRHSLPRSKAMKLSHPCTIRPVPVVRASWIEKKVIRELFDMFGSPAHIERAIRSAVPDCAKLLQRQEQLKAELEKIGKGRQRLIGLIVSNDISDEDARPQLAKFKEREQLFSKELDQIMQQIGNLPTEESVQLYAKKVGEAIRVYDQHGDYFFDGEDGSCATYAGGNDLGTLIAMSRADKRRLVTAVFGPRLPSGKPAGVYISPDNSPRKGGRLRTWNYVLRGLLEFEKVISIDDSGSSSRSPAEGSKRQIDLPPLASPPARCGRSGP